MRWEGVPTPKPGRVGAADWVRVAMRGAPILLLLLVCFPLLLVLRVPERAIWGAVRPVTPWITQFVCIATCRILGLDRRVMGHPLGGPGAMVANHASWLDIFVLNACARIYFVAKSEVRGWGGIGWLARGTGTVFISRRQNEARAHADELETRLRAGHQLLFFPEGTSSDGRRILPFRTTLFQAFFSAALPDDLAVQPVSLVYHAPEGAVPAFYGWWGDMGFAESLLQVLAAPKNGAVDVVFHPALTVRDFADRKALARTAEQTVQRGFSEALNAE